MAFTTATARREDDVTVVAATGMLNMASAPELREAVHDAIADGASRIVVDLAEVDFIDSSGLGALIAGLKSARDAGGDLRLSAPGPQVAMVLQLSNLDRVLVSSPTAEAAYRD
ncbi:STAS domain-containing protein [Clavibacter tessellarius]|uniref:Anti-sigma factor antagonist n=1 Tax=Clavibacter tessellarius TaxID=31965 RepID=A0A225CLW2_9MICO|nr:STAS domain-containing protein [Clavibacter michiganensis]MBT1634688.1 STAS domain-containing protein [Clavibacter michiganensis]OQJ62732.1 anti-anti-sigma factor [Clavibacter michiganensis subsp. tessellarius]UKF34281.1 STAS domain-containing protein [Clavibacter michiganensis subsp. tessellarius]